METDTANLALPPPPPQPQREVNFLSITRSREGKSEEGLNLKLDFNSGERGRVTKSGGTCGMDWYVTGRENICPMYHPLYPSHPPSSFSLSPYRHTLPESRITSSLAISPPPLTAAPSARPPMRRSFNEWFSPSQTSLPSRFIRGTGDHIEFQTHVA